MYGFLAGDMDGFGQLQSWGLSGFGAVTAQEVSTASYVLRQNTYATVAVLANFIQDPFYGLSLSPGDATSAAQQGMTAVIAAQNPGVPPSVVLAAVLAQGSNASIATVTPTLAAPTLPTGTYMASTVTPAQTQANQQMAQASQDYAASPASQTSAQAQMTAAASQYNVPVPTGYMATPDTGTMTSGNPDYIVTTAPTAALGTPGTAALIGGQSTLSSDQMANSSLVTGFTPVANVADLAQTVAQQIINAVPTASVNQVAVGIQQAVPSVSLTTASIAAVQAITAVVQAAVPSAPPAQVAQAVNSSPATSPADIATGIALTTSTTSSLPVPGAVSSSDNSQVLPPSSTAAAAVPAVPISTPISTVPAGTIPTVDQATGNVTPVSTAATGTPTSTAAPSGSSTPAVTTPVNWCFPGDPSGPISDSIPVCTYTAIGAAIILAFFFMKK